MKKFLKNNWLLKLGALAFSIILWITITDTTDPQETHQITGIPIEFLNEDSIYDAGMTYYVEGSETTAVEVNLRESQLKNISASDFKATVDLSKRYGQTGYVELVIEVVNNKNLLEGKYTQLTYAVFIRTEAVKTKTLEIETQIEGSLAGGFTYNEVSVEPNTVNVTAPESVLETISRAVVPVTLNGEAEHVEAIGPIMLYNADDKIINLDTRTEIELDIKEAEVYIPVLKLNTIPIIVEVSGQADVADGYRYISYEADVQSVEISGDRSVVDTISSIVISGDAVDVTGIAEDKTVTLNINDYLPQGVYVNGDNSIINIVFKIEALSERVFDMDYSDVILNGERDNYKYEIVGGGIISVTVIGLAEDLEALTKDNVRLSLSVFDYQPGEYIVPLGVGSINNCSVNAPSSVVIKVTDIESSSEAESSAEQTTQIPQTTAPEETEGTEPATEQTTATPSGEE